MDRAPRTISPLHAAFFLSGVSGLVYEVVWAERVALLAGSTSYAAQAVLATCFAGVAAGAFWLGRKAARAHDGARRYARLELALAGCGVYSAIAFELLAPLAARFGDGRPGAAAAVAFAVTLAACLPATLVMGATFPAMTRGLARSDDADARRLLGRAYAANTAGAVLGSLAGAFVLLPVCGVRGMLGVAVIGNVIAAAIASRARVPVAEAAPEAVAPRPASPRIAAALALGGFAAICLEIVVLRVLGVLLEDTIYTFAIVVAAYILGAALASAWLGRRASTSGSVALGLSLAAAATAAWLATLRLGAPLRDLLVPTSHAFASTRLAEALLGLLLAAPAAIPTTWVFVTLAERAGAGSASLGAGRATAWNGVGCALAPIATSLVLLPLGGTWAVGATAVAALAAAALLVPIDPGARARAWAPLVLAAVPLVLLRGGLFSWPVAPGWRVVWAREGATTAVFIEESPDGLRRLRTNGSFTEGGDAGTLAQTRQGMLPCLLAPSADRALVLGIGTGVTLAGVRAGLPEAHVEAIELLPEVRTALHLFGRSNRDVDTAADVELVVADARTYVAHAAQRGARYGLVVGDLFHANQAGVGALYAREHFLAVRSLLAPGAAYVQWVPLHEMPPRQARTVVRTFFRVFPYGGAFFGHVNLRAPIIGLVGSATPITLDYDALARTLTAPPSRAEGARVAGMERLVDVLGSWVASAESLRAWAGDGPENTDDRHELELGAPRERTPDVGLDNVIALLPARRPPDDVVRFADDATRAAVTRAQAATSAFFRAADAGRRDDLAGAEAELVEALRLDPTLRPAEEVLRGLRGAR